MHIHFLGNRATCSSASALCKLVAQYNTLVLFCTWVYIILKKWVLTSWPVVSGARFAVRAVHDPHLTMALQVVSRVSS